ncbi:MAG: hypothetical protein KGY38_03770 [Desulfobacterales bacterium]|nr:hypothetical protein [Desulfobacterales bacterium]
MAEEKDIVLIYYEDQPLIFARVEEIGPDVKKDWYQIRLMLLQLPVRTVTWILKDDYINGAEFTMGGHRMRLEKVEPPEHDQGQPDEEGQQEETGTDKTDKPEKDESQDSTVISLKNRKPRQT